MVSMKLFLSRGGELLAWTNMERKQVYIIKISSWEPFQYYFVKTMLDVAAFWPVFSPDAKYLALQEVDWAAPVPKNPRLAIYDLKNFQKQTTYDLNSYEANGDVDHRLATMIMKTFFYNYKKYIVLAGVIALIAGFAAFIFWQTNFQTETVKADYCVIDGNGCEVCYNEGKVWNVAIIA